MALDSIVYGFGSSCNETKNITTMNSIRHHCGPRVSNFGKKKTTTMMSSIIIVMAQGTHLMRKNKDDKEPSSSSSWPSILQF